MRHYRAKSWNSGKMGTGLCEITVYIWWKWLEAMEDAIPCHWLRSKQRMAAIFIISLLGLEAEPLLKLLFTLCSRDVLHLWKARVEVVQVSFIDRVPDFDNHPSFSVLSLAKITEHSALKWQTTTEIKTTRQEPKAVEENFQSLEYGNRSVSWTPASFTSTAKLVW